MTTSSDSRIPVTLLTGFLGSGKTTILNHLVRQPELADALVIINEFGAMPLDHLLVAHSTETPVVELSSGCLCCTIRTDLVQTLRDITWRFSRKGQRQFQRVIIETTGLAEPAPIVHTLLTHPQLAARYRLDGIVVTLDLAAGHATLDQHPESVHQTAMADCLLLTKGDLADARTRRTLLSRLDAINPAAPRHEVRHGAVPAGVVLNLGLFSADGKTPDVVRWLHEAAYADAARDSDAHDHAHAEGHPHDHPHDASHHHDSIQAFCFALDTPIPATALTAWLDALRSLAGADVLRIKGILNIEGQDTPLVIHSVQHIFHPPVTLPAWPDADRRSRLVCITRDIGRDVLETALRGVLRTAR